MKKYIIILVALFAMSTHAQEVDMEEPGGNVWEIKANGLFLVLGVAELSVERSLNSESAIGVSAALPFTDETKDDIEYYISPYYRMYFGSGYASGFFLEGFGMLNSTEREFFDIGEEDQDKFVTDFALGIGLGGKWVTKKGFIGELSFGIGRNLFNTDETDYDVIGKGGITLGYRF